MLFPGREIPKYLKAVAERSSRKGDSQSPNSRAPMFPAERVTKDVKVLSDACFADDAPIYRHLEKSWPSISLKGEIHLSRTLFPSSAFVPFSVQVSPRRDSFHFTLTTPPFPKYEVQVNPPTVDGLCYVPRSIPGASVPIYIATQFALDVERPVKMLRGHSRRDGDIARHTNPSLASETAIDQGISSIGFPFGEGAQMGGGV